MRELVRHVQEARKKAGLEVTDRILLRVDVPDDLSDALRIHRDYIAEETLASTSDFDGAEATIVNIDDHPVRFAIGSVEAWETI